MTIWLATVVALWGIPTGDDRGDDQAGQGGVHMGQVHYDEVMLEDLIARVRDGHATLALVRLDTPEYKKRAYPVPGGNGKTCPPYDFIEYRGVVERVVRASRQHPALEGGKALAIVPANVPDLVYISHRACVDGTSKSPIWPRFAGASPAPGARLLVVLTHNDEYGWRELMSGAWLPEAELAKIEKLLAAPAQP